nr:reverse transcriptase domain-containing protein [Tanacetum cinerariifolium]
EAYKITWVEFKKLLIKKYCPRTEVQKMEDECYHLTMKGNDLKTYVRKFQELATLCPTMVSDSEGMIEAFIGALPQSIEGNVTASKPQTLKEAINIAQRLMDQNRRQETFRSYAATPTENSRTMSSPNHLTSNTEDAFSEYVSVVPDYSPALPCKTYSSASNNSTCIIPTSSNFSLFHNNPYINVMNAYATFTPSPIPIPPPIIKPPSESPEFFLPKELLSPKKRKQNKYFQDYEIGESSHDSTLEQHGKQIEEILNHLDELSLDRIERIEDVE